MQLSCVHLLNRDKTRSGRRAPVCCSLSVGLRFLQRSKTPLSRSRHRKKECWLMARQHSNYANESPYLCYVGNARDQQIRGLLEGRLVCARASWIVASAASAPFCTLHICVRVCVLLGRVFMSRRNYFFAKRRKTTHASILSQKQARKAQLYRLSLSELRLASILQHHLLLTAPGNLLCYSTLLCPSHWLSQSLFTWINESTHTHCTFHHITDQSRLEFYIHT